MELEQLIQAVRDQRVIWDSRLSGYRDLTAKENAWDEVASTLGKNSKHFHNMIAYVTDYLFLENIGV